jgi:hypothetical protein
MATDDGHEAPGQIVPRRAELSTLEGSELARIPPIIQVPWVLLALAGLGYSAYKDGASAVSLAWAAFTFIGLVINSLSDVALPGGGKLSFRTKFHKVQRAAEKSQESTESLERVLADYSKQLQSWTNAIVLFIEHLDKYGTSEAEIDAILARFCLERMEEAKAIIGERGDTLRISLWWYSEDEDGLRLLFSDDIVDEKTMNHLFRPRAGLCGQCFIEDRMYNLPDAPSSSYYEKIVDNPVYRGLLLMPVKLGTKKTLGVLSIDRARKEEFNSNAENVAGALSGLLAFAMETGLERIEALGTK